MADSENQSKDPVSKNTSENKTENISDTELLILSEVDGNEEISNVFSKSSVGCDVEMKEESTDNPINMNVITPANKNVEDERNKKVDTVTVSPKTSSEGDDFDLDDVIEEFAKEESKIAKLDDELDFLVDQFVEAEYSNPKTEEIEVKTVLSDSDDDMVVILEDFKPMDSDDECLIVEDSLNEIIIKDDEPPKPKLSKIEKYNSAQVQTKELQSIDNRINASSSNLVETSLSDDIQEMPVTNSNATENCTVSCNADLLTKSVANFKTSEPKPLDLVNSCESQMACQVIDNANSHDNTVSKRITETVDSGKQVSVDSIKNENTNSCDPMEIPVVAVQSSELKSSDTKPLDTVISCDSQTPSHALIKNENLCHDANSKQASETIDMTGVENGKAHSCDSIEIAVGTAQTINAKPESHSSLGTNNSCQSNCDLSSMEATLVVNENLNLKVDCNKNVSKDNENINLVAKAVLDYLLKELSTSLDEETLSNETNVSTLKNDQNGIDSVSTVEDVAMNKICMSNSDSSLSSVCHNSVEKCFQNKSDIEILEGHSSLRNTDGTNPISVVEVSRTCASNSDSSPSSVCHNVDEKCTVEICESGIKICESNSSSRNDQNAINPVSIVENVAVNKTCILNSDSSPSSICRNLAEKCSQEKTDIETLESKSSSRNDQNGIDSVSIMEVVAVNVACTSNSDSSPSSAYHNLVEKCSQEKSESDIEILGNCCRSDEDGTNSISVADVAANRNFASNSDSFPSSVCHNVVAKCSEKSESSIKILEASSYGEEGGQDDIVIDTKTAKESHSVSESSSEHVKLPILSDESEAAKDTKKRKISEVDDENSDIVVKKIKDENLIEVEIADVESIVDNKIRESVLELIPETDSLIETKKKHLDIIAKRMGYQTVQLLFSKDCARQREIIKDFEEKLQVLNEDLLFFKTKASELVSAQQESFKLNKFNPQVQMRTVGVNVKIFRECDLPKTYLHHQPVPKPQPQVPHTNPEKPKTMMTILKETILAKAVPPTGADLVEELVLRLNSAQVNKSQEVVHASLKPRPVTYSKEQVQQIQQPAVPQRMAVPRVVTRANLSAPRYFPVSPNVTMTGNPLAVAAPGMSRSIAPRLSTIAPNVRASSGSNVIDLTDDEANKKLLSTNTNISIPTTVSKVNLPAVSGNQQNVLVPISSFLQMLPSAQGQTIRQALVPSLPSGLGKKTVAYTCIVPNNSMAARSPVQISGSNRLQTFFVQVPNAGSAPLNNIVNNSQRLIGPSSLLNASTSQSSTAPSSSSASPLLLIPRAPVHPAPFPPIPNYPNNSKLKAIPPKPSLKGSRSPTGIILSWNVCLFSTHAQINNYQLFAYQETSGPVTCSLWKKVGDVNALPLPMACTLTQFLEGNRYYFTVRAVDTYSRIGPFSDAVSIMYSKDKAPNSK